MEKGVILQYFEWYTPSEPHLWVELKENAKKLKEAGFSAIWMPPSYKGIAGKNDVGYGAYDLYDLGEFDAKGSIPTKYGTKDELLTCVESLHEAGLDVYSDVVLDHKMGADGFEKVKAREVANDKRDEFVSDEEEIEVATIFNFPARKDKYSSFHWNWEDFDGIDYDNTTHRHADYLFASKQWDDEVDNENENYDYLMGADLDFSNSDVVEECKRWGLWYLETVGNDGFRLDALKHIKASFYKEWIADLRQKTNKELFTVGEYWHGDVNRLLHYLQLVNYQFSLFDVPLHYNFYHASHSMGAFDMRDIFKNTLVACSPARAVTFVDNHDTQPAEGLQSFIDDWFKKQAYALILLREEGYPCVFYGDYYGIAHNHIASKRDMIDEMLEIRKDRMEGARHDYFNNPDIIGWTYEGLHQNGFAVIMTNARGGSRQMYMGESYRGCHMSDGKHEVVISDDGIGTFLVDDGDCSIYVTIE